MIGNDVVSIIQEKLGFRSDLNTNILAKMNEAMRLLEKGRTLPKFLIEEDVPLTTVANQRYISLPAGFIKVDDDGHPNIEFTDGTGLIYLKQGPWPQLRQIFQSTEAGIPRAFTLRKTQIWFHPVPVDAYDLVWSYYKHDNDITGAAENNWLRELPYLIAGKAGLSMAQNLNSNSDIIRYFEGMAREWAIASHYETSENDTAGPVVMGSNL